MEITKVVIIAVGVLGFAFFFGSGISVSTVNKFSVSLNDPIRGAGIVFLLLGLFLMMTSSYNEGKRDGEKKAIETMEEVVEKKR